METTPRTRWTLLVGLLLVLAVVIAATVGLLRIGSDAPATAEAPAASAPATATGGPAAPDLTFTLTDGRDVSLADFQGRPLVLNFWASWCPPCVAEMGDALRPVHEAHGDDVEFLGMNLQDEPEAAQQILDSTGVTYELAVDPTGEIFAAFEGVGMPTTVFIDSDGRIVEKHTGVITRDQLESQVVALKGA